MNRIEESSTEQMKVLFIGGTGIISSACVRAAVQHGIELTIFTRGVRERDLPPSVKVIRGDIRSDDRKLLKGSGHDAVVQWVAYKPAEVERDFEFFAGQTGQYIFISSASAYQKPPSHYVITETTPLSNPYWEYSRNKIACEHVLMRAHRESGFPVTIVRPSLTYGDTQIPLAVNSWELPYTAVDRMRKRQEVIVPGDGTSLWVNTHNSDFAKGLVGLLGNPLAVGETFHITTDEVLTWNEIYRITAEAAGVEPRLIHIASDFLAACLPEMVGSLIGDKANSVAFDNRKIKRVVPDYTATTSYAEGIRQTIAWFDADRGRRQIDEAANAAWDRLIQAYRQGMEQAVRKFKTASGA
jgi:nucleoside-diphosphate-sugar epimerase